MFRSFYSFATSALVAAACLNSVPANAIELCETRFRSLCTDNCYIYSGPVTEGVLECDKLNLVITQDSLSAPPADPILQCDRTSQGYTCEAWPQGEQISYDWYGDDNTAIATDITNPFRYFSCTAGTVSIAVTGPGGGTSIASTTLPACN
jgi:hypothetical protein